MATRNGPTILVDTREKDPWEFPGNCRVVRAALRSGDYSVRGLSGEGGILLERKSVADLFGTLTRGTDRFRRELGRMAELGGFRAVVVEGTMDMVVRGSWNSGANGHRVLRSLLRVCMEFGVAPMFAGNAYEASVLAFKMLEEYWLLKN